MPPLNLDGKLPQPKQEYSVCTATTSTYVECKHKNGTYFTVKFWIFKKKFFFCYDCHSPLIVDKKGKMKKYYI